MDLLESLLRFIRAGARPGALVAIFLVMGTWLYFDVVLKQPLTSVELTGATIFYAVVVIIGRFVMRRIRLSWFVMPRLRLSRRRNRRRSKAAP